MLKVDMGHRSGGYMHACSYEQKLKLASHHPHGSLTELDQWEIA